MRPPWTCRGATRYPAAERGATGRRYSLGPVKPLGTPIEVPRVTMARAAAVLFGTGGALALLSLAVPHWHMAHPTAAALLAVPALPLALLLYAFAAYVPEWAIHVLLVVAVIMLSLA